MASFPVGMMPFLLEIRITWGSSDEQEIPRAPDDAADQKARQYLLIRLIRAIRPLHGPKLGTLLLVGSPVVQNSKLCLNCTPDKA
jgi:hypothetical protein